jgi:ribonuclease P protein component
MDSLKRCGLPAKERIKSRKDFEELYAAGRLVFSSDKKIKAIYLISEDINPGVRISPAVSSKAGNAVWRNRVKRLIKEAYRLNKEVVTGPVLQKKVLLRIVFSPGYLNKKNNIWPELNEIVPGVVEIMLKIKSVL